MRAFLVGLALLAVAGLASGQVPLAPAASPNDVLTLLQSLPISPELKSELLGEVPSALATGLLSPRVAVPFLQALSALPQAQIEQTLSLVHEALEEKFIVDPLLLETLKGLRLARPWPEVMGTLQRRFALLRATRTVLQAHGLLPMTPKGTSPSPSAKLISELAWAIGDYLSPGGSPTDAATIESKVRERLVRLRGTALAPGVVDPLIAALSPALVQEIAGLALNPERR